MGLKSTIEKKVNSDGLRHFWDVSQEIIEACAHHLAQITAQMPNYDIHDKEHSQKVLENIELFLGDNAEKLSVYELILIYLSCYLHDSAMALPQWEYDMLRAVEGCEECYDNSTRFSIKNDFNMAQSLSHLKSFIDQHKGEIYQNYEEVSRFVFAPGNEEQLQLDIAKRARSYEEFRNGFADKLSATRGNLAEYLRLSESIRYEYIRKTHHTRAADYISNLRKKLSHEIGESAAVKVVTDLSNVCRAHGEPIEFVWELDQNSNADPLGTANLRFVALMLRLGDATHFSYDRAPVSLFSEKGITNRESRAHWEAKFAETKYSIATLHDGKKTICFSAFCTEPSVYYFLHDYINLIDVELSYYFSFLHDLEFRKQDTTVYDLQLNNKVDRTGIIPDTEKFLPDNDARFSMDQSKILSLLMGTQLYKDKYLCLRELYQNSLDACKCMKAQDESVGVQSKYKIVFGLETTNDGRKYIYCLDNGTGMTKEIVKNYFLRIGNSYYKSQEFIGKNVGWMDKVNPTSQFGIGVLSCFMIGDSLEVTTKHYDAQADAFSFCAEANNEHFYYVPVNPLDEERIGTHGTLIKIFLSEEESQSINNTIPKNLELLIYVEEALGLNKSKSLDYLEADLENLRSSIFYKLNRQAGISSPDIDVFVQFEGTNIPLIPRTQIFDYKAAGLEDTTIVNIWKAFKNGIQYKDILKCHDHICNMPIHISKDGVELETFITLPRKGIPLKSQEILLAENYTWKNNYIQVLVDGITVSERRTNGIRRYFGYKLERFGHIIINFVGKIRPTLSIDRNAVVSYPEEALHAVEELLSKLLDEITLLYLTYLKEQEICINSDDLYFSLDLLLYLYEDFAGEILEKISKTEYGKTLVQGDYAPQFNSPISITDMINSEDLYIKNADFRYIDRAYREIIYGKMIPNSHIVVDDINVVIKSTDLCMPSSFLDIHCYDDYDVVVRANVWKGVYEAFDLATNIWPIIPERLFNKITECEARYGENGSHTKVMTKVGNGLHGIATLKATLINPSIGITRNSHSVHNGAKSCVGRYGEIEDDFWLFELNQHGEMVRSDNKDYALFVYISPDKLSEEDERKLQDYEGNDDTYVKGVKEGWSILFLGYDQTYYILPGKREKNELIALIPPSIRDRKDSVVYYNLDETPLFR